MDSAPDFESGGCGFESRRECSFIFSVFVLFACSRLQFVVVRPRLASIAQLAEHVLRKHKVTSSILVGGLSVVTASGRWSRGMILPSGGRGRGFDSRTAPFLFVFAGSVTRSLLVFYNTAQYAIRKARVGALQHKYFWEPVKWNLERGHPLKLERYRED